MVAEDGTVNVVMGRRWAGIDPGSDVGLVGLLVPAHGAHAHSAEHARLIGYSKVTASSSRSYTRAGRRGSMLLRVRERLIEWRITDIVLEEPSTHTNSWAKSDGGRSVATGTLFGLGAHFGLCLGAAVTMPWETRVWSYPPTTSKKARTAAVTDYERLGWMQARAPKPTRQATTLENMQKLFDGLYERPADGMFRTMERTPSEHELMALGVLNFHLMRERGAV